METKHPFAEKRTCIERILREGGESVPVKKITLPKKIGETEAILVYPMLDEGRPEGFMWRLYYKGEEDWASDKKELGEKILAFTRKKYR